MRGYKTINQFNLQDCESFLKTYKKSSHEGQVRQRYAKLIEEQQRTIRIQQEREQQELDKQATKTKRRKIGADILYVIGKIIIYAIMIYVVYLCFD